MKIRKIISWVAVIVTMCAVFATCGLTAPAKTTGKIVIKIGHVVQDGTPLDSGLDKLAKLLKKRSGGVIRAEVYPNSTLGGNRELLEQLQLGTLEMCAPSVAALGGFTKNTALLDLPYLFKNNKAAQQVLDGEIGRTIFAGLEDSGFVGMGWLTTGWRHVTANKAIRTPAGMKGLKIRVMENNMHIDHFKALGASPTPMAFSEVFTALQQGAIDCQENPFYNIKGNRFNEVQKYIIMTGHIYDTAPLLASKNFWDRLPKKYQNMIMKAMVEVLKYERRLSIEDEEKTANEFRKNGKNVVIKLTDKERAAFRKAAQPVYDKYAKSIGTNLIAKVNAINAKN
ncbi:MAG: DctP family TRAP transporter solute-binding subunit [Bacillota bacterium]